MDTQESLEKDFRCGMVSIIGRPNTGKSTLLNALVDEKIAIVSSVPQTTRNRIRGIYNDKNGQIIFVDTPGLHLPQDRLGTRMNSAAEGAMHEADCIIYLVDANKPVGPEEEMIVNRLKNIKVPVILGLNKIDLNGKRADEYISLWEKIKGKPISEMKSFILLPLSGKNCFNIDKLIGIIFEFLPLGPALYPTDIVSDMPQRMAIADIIREKLFEMMRDELPHSLAVNVEEIALKQKETTYIRAEILVERDSQKEIVIGKEGQVLKKVGTLARIELEELLESKVFLDLHVKWQKKWRDDDTVLQDLGYAQDV